MDEVIVSGAFDDLHLADYRFLEEAAKLGRVHAMVWPDEIVNARTGNPPKFPLAERRYLLESIRYVAQVTVDASLARRPLINEAALKRLPSAPSTPANPTATSPTGKKVIVTGCYDYFHSGHLRSFEECAELGDLYVTVGSDENIRQLKGASHPLFPAQQRRYIVGSIRFVKQAIIATGMGWLDAEPEIERIRPDIYAVNEDGDKPEKRAFCQRKGIDYRVLSRQPKPGLPRRASTTLRGF